MKKNFISSFFNLINKKRITTVAGAWVYYFLMALVPFVFLIVTAFGVFGVSLTHDLVSRLPIEFRSAGQKIIETAEKSSKGVTIFFIVAVIFSCTNLLNQMSKDGDFIYEAHSKTKRGIFRRLWAIFALAMLFVLFLGVAFIFAFGNRALLNAHIDRDKQLILIIFTFLFVICLGYVIILLLNVFISPIKQSFKGIALGSFISLFVVVLGTIGFTLYLRFIANYNAFYGSLAGVIIFLVWAYICMLGLSFGVIINMQIYKAKKEQDKNQKQLREKKC